MKEPFGKYLGLVAGVTVAGLLAAQWLGGQHKVAAQWGVGVAGVTGVLALFLKRRALKKKLSAVLAVVGWVLLARVVAVAVALFALMKAGQGVGGFVVGFFGIYFVLQWVEIGYLLAVRKQMPAGQ